MDGEPCTEKIEWARSQGVFDHPDWYPGLGPFSSYESFQDILHSDPTTKEICPRPCSCHTAMQGEACYDKVRWAMSDGIIIHPEYYPGLSVNSRFEDFQQHLFESGEEFKCQKPCRAPHWGSPSLFCFAVIVKDSYELGLIKAQLSKAVGIFLCEDFLVIADGKLGLGTGPHGTVMTAEIPHIPVGRSKDGTAANTLVFMKAWDQVKMDGRWRQHDFILKADPDSVCIAYRLREKLRPIMGQNVYVKNCGKLSGPGWPMMFGSLEAFGKPAVQAYFNGAQRCANELPWQAWGEDLFIQRCLDHLGVGSTVDFSLSGDNVCTGASCGDGFHGNYHPYKDLGAWMACWNQAVR
uniref:Hexosyltransferase n=1 Tax=Alexandrium andersonii TaxID=327968 RepID=A0A7S2J182_9DINO